MRGVVFRGDPRCLPTWHRCRLVRSEGYDRAALAVPHKKALKQNYPGRGELLFAQWGPCPGAPLWRRGIVIGLLRSLTYPFPRAPLLRLSEVPWLAWGLRRATGAPGACLALGRGEQASTRRDRRERVRAQRRVIYSCRQPRGCLLGGPVAVPAELYITSGCAGSGQAAPMTVGGRSETLSGARSTGIFGPASRCEWQANIGGCMGAGASRRGCPLPCGRGIVLGVGRER